MYSEKVMEHFKHPRNMGEMKNPDGVGVEGNPTCGDVMTLYIKVKNNKIADVKFQTLGCAAALAVSSSLTELVKGKTIEQALKIKSEEIVKQLGGLPILKYHCSVLGLDALKMAIKDYKSKQDNKAAAKKGR
jgi:nitrogen fixation NifU-like protein